MEGYLWAALLLILNTVAWLLTLLSLPGNWLILLFTALFAWLLPEQPDGVGVSWTIVGVLLVLAVIGEIVEFLAGAAGAAKLGGSRRAVALSVIGAIVGSIGGALIGVPIPIVGPIIGAVGGGGLGAFAGAYAGESWKGRLAEERMAISKAALVGRLLGTLGKLLIGVVMVIVAAVDAFL